MDTQTMASAMVYLGTGVLTTVTHQILVYQGAGAPQAMLVPFFNYTGMSLVELWPQSCGGLDTSTSNRRKPVRTRHAGVGEEADSADRESGAGSHQESDTASRRPAGGGAVPGNEEGAESVTGSGTVEAAAAAGAPAVVSRGDPSGADEVIMCPVGQRVGPCMPRWLLSVLSRPMATNTVIAASVAIDLAGFTAGTVGVKLAGSGVYQVVHASVVVFAALFAWILRGRMINRAQWGAIMLITLGLAISAMGSGSSTGHSTPRDASEPEIVSQLNPAAADGEAVPGSDLAAGSATASASSLPGGRRLSGAVGSDEGESPNDAASIASGIVFTLVGAILYGLNYSLLDALSSTPTAPAQSRLAGAIGSWAAAAVSLWVLGVTVPGWDELLGHPTNQAGGSQFVLLLGFGMIALSALAHSLAYFRLLKGHGAVMIGVLQALRAALVFLAGSVLFCGYQESQCLTAPRGIAASLVAIGVMAFAGSKRRTATTPQSAH